MITKAVIAAAGKGTRMMHLSKDKPKHLIKVLGKPFLYYLLQNLVHAGIKEIILITGYKKEKMEEFTKEYKDKFNITLINQFDKFGEDKYGTSVPIECAEDAVEGEQFLALYGDNLYLPSDIKKFLYKDEYNYIGVLEHKHPERYGVAVTDNNDLLLKMVEKPKDYISNTINTGIYKFMPEIFNEIKKVKPSPRGEYELTDAVQSLADKKKVKVIRLQSWHDFGKPEDVEIVSKALQK